MQRQGGKGEGCFSLLTTYALAIVVEESLELDDVRVADDAHDLEFTILDDISHDSPEQVGMYVTGPRLTLKRLSWRTRLMAASSPLGDNFVWKTTPNEPLPTILHCVYGRFLYSPVRPSCTFS